MMPSLPLSRPSTMRAVVVHGPGDYRLDVVPVPELADEDLLLEVEAVGICASDLKCWHGAAKFWGDETRPAWAQKGVVAGHEFVGRVVEGSPSALRSRGLHLGDRISCEQIVPCGECRYCTTGSYWMCLRHDMFGFRSFDGAMADYVRVPPRAIAHLVDGDLPPEHAAFVEPFSCAMHAVERARLEFGDVVVVAGAGPIGLAAVAAARQKNPLLIVALDLSPTKLGLARACGADVTIDVSAESAVERVRELTDGYGADVYIEATGHPSAVEQGLALLRKRGRFVEYSVFKDPVSVDRSVISDDKELDVLGAHLGPGCWPAAASLLVRRVLPLDDICTHQFPLERFQDALDLVGDSTGGSIKVSILPSLPAGDRETSA